MSAKRRTNLEQAKYDVATARRKKLTSDINKLMRLQERILRATDSADGIMTQYPSLNAYWTVDVMEAATHGHSCRGDWPGMSKTIEELKQLRKERGLI